MARYAVIDVGTNSIKCLLAEQAAGGAYQVISDRADIARLGEQFYETGRLQPEAMARNVREIARMAQAARADGADAIIGVGTMCLRAAANAPEFVRQVEQACGLTIEILSGAEEARLGFLAATSGLPAAAQRVMVFDAGGGSTECIVGQHGRIEQSVSVPLGAVVLTEQHGLSAFPATASQIDGAMAVVLQQFTPRIPTGMIDAVIGIGGTVTTMCAVKLGLTAYNTAAIEGATVERAEVERQIALYDDKTLSERQQIPGLHPKRADVILGGALIVKGVMELTGVDAIRVSSRGLRHGVMADWRAKARAGKSDK